MDVFKFKKNPYLLPAIIIFTVLLADQILKFWIKTNMYIGESIPVFGDWFLLRFIENNGMAFGMEFFGSAGKLFLSIFRVGAVVLITFYMRSLIRKKTAPVLIACFALIVAGALGNILDSAFYGRIFSESPETGRIVAVLFPEGGGYAPFLHGKVVDMLYFPVIDVARETAPSWLPDFLFGNDGRFTFFRPIFNIADAAITIGVALFIVFCRKMK
ncbi:MAG: lipoprotein signal peptidase [Bacteroidales bacterium]|nr:lipoprotein signal peptidase [Bacteroidales bacterium]